MRRFTRLTNAFSKKIENHAHAVALHCTFYNFVRIHKTLRCSPAMAAGLTDRLWEMRDIVALIEQAEAATRAEEARSLQAARFEAGPDFKLGHYLTSDCIEVAIGSAG